MKKFILLLVLVLLCTAPVIAQSPVQDTIPQLKEWWRADNMQYAKYGMTWLENFYQGKGALVVWTPQGVKTWLLRFPGDTMNVFTWEKGSANIKTGDFNGDGIIDYIDEKSNIYQGIKNGELPKTEAVYFGGYYPEISVDVNGDGNDDIFNFPSSSLPRPPAEMKVAFGYKDLNKMYWQTIPMSHIDSNNAVVGCFTKGKEIYVVCRRYFWHYEKAYSVIDRDGLRLVRVWWDGGGFKSEVLDEFTVDTQNGTGIYWVGGLHSQPQGKYYFLCATQIEGNVNNTDLTVYDLSINKIEKLYGFRMDGIKSINSLRYGVDSTEVPSFCIRQYAANPILRIYNGNISNSFHELAQFKVTHNPTLPVTGLITLPDVTKDGKSDIALSNRLAFTIINSQNASTVIEEQNTRTPISLQVLPPMPIKRLQPVQIKITTSALGAYTLRVYNSAGKQVLSKGIQIENGGDHYIYMDLSVIISGNYTLQLAGNGHTAQCSIVIQ
ncbi:MAG: VCBS repeat-containing protein [Candidatus Kapaibacterium sp.]